MVKNCEKKRTKNCEKNAENNAKKNAENCDKLETKFGKSIKYVQLDNAGNITKIVGSGKAQDFRNPDFVNAKNYKTRYKGYWDEDIFRELNIRRLMK